MDNEKKDIQVEIENKEEIEAGMKQYTKQQLKEIRFHWFGMFVIFYLVLAFAAMKDLIAYIPLMGHIVAVGLAGFVSYFMSFTMYEWVKKKGWYVYLAVVVIVILMFCRY